MLTAMILIFGSNYTVLKIALKYSDPFVFAFLRTAIGSVLTIPLSIYALTNMRKRDEAKGEVKVAVPKDRKTFLYIFLFGITSSTFFFGFWYSGEIFVSASVTSVLINTNPLFVVIAAYFLLKEKVSRLQILGLAFGFAGALLVASNGSLSQLSGNMRGYTLLFLSAASYGGSIVVYKKYLTAFEPITVNMMQLFFAALGLLAWIAVSNPEAFVSAHYNSTYLIALLYTTIFGTVIANLIFMALVRERGPTWFSMWLFLNPVAAVAISSIVLGQTLTIVQIVGMLLVVFSIYEINKALRITNALKQSSGNFARELQ